DTAPPVAPFTTACQRSPSRSPRNTPATSPPRTTFTPNATAIEPISVPATASHSSPAPSRLQSLSCEAAIPALRHKAREQATTLVAAAHNEPFPGLEPTRPEILSFTRYSACS